MVVSSEDKFKLTISGIPSLGKRNTTSLEKVRRELKSYLENFGD